MKKKFSLTILLVGTIVFGLHAQSDVSASEKKPNGIIIDGELNDWDRPLHFFEDKTGLSYAIGNDRDNLYLVFTWPDGMKMRRAMSAGWMLQLISKDKKNKFKVSLTLPAIRMNWMEGYGDAGPMARRVVENPLISNYKSQISAIGAKGFSSHLREVSLNETKGIRIAIAGDSLLHIIYEMAIPLSELYVQNSSTFAGIIVLNVNVNAMERPPLGNGSGEGFSERGGDRPSGAISGGGRSGAGRSGLGGGRSGGGMSRRNIRGNGMSDRGGLFEKASLRQKFTLSANF